MASSVRIVHRKEFKKFASVGNFQAFLITVCLAQLADDFFFFQTVFKQLLNGILVENGKLLMHIFA